MYTASKNAFIEPDNVATKGQSKSYKNS